jgi:hypothetical protein
MNLLNWYIYTSIVVIIPLSVWLSDKVIGEIIGEIFNAVFHFIKTDNIVSTAWYVLQMGKEAEPDIIKTIL